MELWPAESIWEQLSPRLPGFTVEVLPEIDSSNTELMRRARAAERYLRAEGVGGRKLTASAADARAAIA